MGLNASNWLLEDYVWDLWRWVSENTSDLSSVSTVKLSSKNRFVDKKKINLNQMNQREKTSVDEKEILAALKNKSEFISIDFCRILYQCPLYVGHRKVEKCIS